MLVAHRRVWVYSLLCMPLILNLRPARPGVCVWGGGESGVVGILAYFFSGNHNFRSLLTLPFRNGRIPVFFGHIICRLVQ